MKTTANVPEKTKKPSSAATKRAPRRKLYPLTAAQKLHSFTLKYCPKKQVLNIGTSLTIEDEIDFDILKRAIRTAYERCDAMRIRFCEKKGEIFQYIVPKDDQEIEYKDFTGMTMKDAEAEMRKWSEIPFERYDSPMSRIVMITTQDGFKGVYLNVDHMIMDSSAIVVFMSDLVTIYCSYKYDYPFPKPLASYQEQLEKDLAYESGKAFLRDQAFWKDFITSSEPIFCDISNMDRLNKEREANGNIRTADVTCDNVEANHLVFHLEEEPSRQLTHFCQQHEIPMVCLLLTALRTQMSKNSDSEPDVSITTTVARRGTLAEKKCGGTRIHCFPCRTIINRDLTFFQALEVMREAQNNIFRHADYDPVTVMTERSEFYHTAPGQSYESMSLTYQPLTLQAMRAELPDVQCKSMWYPNGVAGRSLYLTVMHQSLNDSLDFYFEYQTGRVTEDELEKLYYFMCRIMFAGVANPHMTIGELIDNY